MQSPYFCGEIGITVPPSDFPIENCLIDESKYSYEGSWIFCRFDGEEIYGARFGFGRGYFDVSDYGIESPIPRSFLMLHVELMTRDGAVLWQGTGRFTAEQVSYDESDVDISLHEGDRELFRVQGWPLMHWRFQSDDGEIEIDVAIDLKNATILPDCIMPHNLFAMWLATGPIQGSVRYGSKCTEVTGTAFYDHPRINPVEHAVPKQGYYLYTPMRFDDGSLLAAYYTEDTRCNRIDNYSFALYIDAAGKAFWLDEAELCELRFDADEKPSQWLMRWQSPEMVLTASCEVRQTDVLRAWGNPSMQQTRKENSNIPLVFDCEVNRTVAGKDVRLRGGGIGEYLAYAGYQPPV